VLFGQPSTVLQPSGVAEPVDLGGLDFAQSKRTSADAKLSSILRGNVRRIDVNGSESCRQLPCLKGTLPDDDDGTSTKVYWLYTPVA